MRDKRLSIMEIRGERVSGGRGRTWERKSYVDPHSSPPLTVKLRGRTTTPDRRRGRTLSPSARGAKQTTPHGPLQRLLGACLIACPLGRIGARRMNDFNTVKCKKDGQAHRAPHFGPK